MPRFTTWQKTQCYDCGQEFTVTRSEPKTFDKESDVICNDCKNRVKAIKEGYDAGYMRALCDVSEALNKAKCVDGGVIVAAMMFVKSGEMNNGNK